MIIPLNLGEQSYDIVLERGALNKASEYLNLNRKCLIVTDSGVPSQYAEAIKKQAKDGYIVTIQQGEASKNFDSYKMLLAYKAETKEPHPVARMMSDMKIRGKLMMNNSEKTVADLMTDGCNMGVKSLSKYLNQYKNASEDSKNIARDIITSENNLNEVLRYHL